MELYFKYLEGVQQADKRIEGEKHVGVPLFYLLSLQPWQSFSSSLCFLFILQIIKFILIFLVEHRWIVVIHSPKQVENWHSIVIANYSDNVNECANQVQQPYFLCLNTYLFQWSTPSSTFSHSSSIIIIVRMRMKMNRMNRNYRIVTRQLSRGLKVRHSKYQKIFSFIFFISFHS